MEKLQELIKYSNPSKVQKVANNYFGKPIPIYISSHKNKKYMIKSPDGKWIHFGQMGYEDFTKHNDKERRYKFRRRNHKWGDTQPYSPASLSYYLLW